MSELTRLRELATEFPPPEFDELAAVAATRRRRRATALVTSATAVAVAAVLVAAGLGGPPRTSQPVDPPTPTPTWDAGTWPPQRVVAEGDGGDYSFFPANGPGPDARLWEVCLARRCAHHWSSRQERHTAVEVSTDDFRSGSLFDLTRSRRDPRTVYLERFDENTVFAQDVVRPRSLRQRFRLLDADGTQVVLDLVPGTAPAAPGPEVVRSLQSSDLYRIDRESETIQRLDTPSLSYGWAPVLDEVLWGVDAGCVITWLDTEGTWRRHDVRCQPGSSLGFVDPAPEGLMVVDGPRGMEVSDDGGETWQHYSTGAYDAQFVTGR